MGCLGLVFYDDKMWLADPASSVRVLEVGPLRATLEIRRRILHSEYVQRISLAHNSPRLDFDTTIDWRERHILLKVAFPADVSVLRSSSFVSVDRPNIVVETIKRAEDGHGLIVRFYESQRRRGPATLTAGFDLEQVWRTNLLEENQVALAPESRSVSLFVKPYEIVTLRLVPVRE